MGWPGNLNCILKTMGNNFEFASLTARTVCTGLEQKTDVEEEMVKVLDEEKLFQIFYNAITFGIFSNEILLLKM